MYYKLLSIIFLLSILNFSHANSFPRGCELSGYGNTINHIVFNQDGKQSYYLVQNTTDDWIQMQRVLTEQGLVSPALSIKLAPYQWAAFASNIANYHFQCNLFNQDTTEYNAISCEQVIQVCQYPRVRFSISNQGNYWVSANKSQQEIINDSVAKGIYLKW